MCNKMKTLDNFHKSKNTKDGYYSYCSPCKVEANRKSSKKQMSINREKHLRQRKNNHLKTMYGITIEDYDRMFEEQGGVCAICKQSESQSYRKLAVDHCHKTNRVRALLCYGCDRGIGSFKENPESLLAAAKYLSRY